MTRAGRAARASEKQGEVERSAPAFIHLANEDGASPIHEQIYQRIRGLILSGAMQYGSRLAPSRSLASTLGVSRNSVLTAIDRLTADGLLDSRHGSGVYVAYSGAYSTGRVKPPDFDDSDPVPFHLGAPPIDAFPAKLWSRLVSRRWQHISPSSLRAGDPAGWIGLREAIAAYVAMTRGLQCSPDEVIVTSCATASVDLVARSLGWADREIWMENPGYNAVSRALQNSGARVVPVPLDKYGLDLAAGQRLAPRAKAAFVTPACQFPTSIAMSMERRRALIDWANSNSSWILEDDFDWNNNEDAPLRPLAAIDRSRTIYLNTFNHMMFPTLQISYIVAPAALVDRFAAVQRSLNGSANVPNQMVMADFINGGHLDEHVKRLRTCWEERRMALLQSLDRFLFDYLAPEDHRAGSHVVCISTRLSAGQIVSRAKVRGISVASTARYQFIANSNDQILLGFMGFAPPAIADAALKLRGALGAH